MTSGTTPRVLGGEHRPGPAEAGGDLVEDQHQAVLVGDLAHHAQAAAGRRRTCRRRPAARGSTMIPASSSACSASSARIAARHHRRVGPDVAAGRGRLVGEHLLGQHAAEHRVHPADRVADAHAAERVAVVAAAHGQHPGALGTPGAALVLQHHLERHLDADTEPESARKTCSSPVGRQRRPAARPAGSPARGSGRRTSRAPSSPSCSAWRPRRAPGGVAVDRGPPRRHRVDDLAAPSASSAAAARRRGLTSRIGVGSVIEV